MNTAQNLMSFEAHRDHRNTMIYHSVASRRGVLLSLGAMGLGSLGLALTSCSSTTGINAGATDSPTASGSPNASASVAPSGSASATPSAAPSSGSTQAPGNPVPTPRPWDGPQTGLVGEGKYVAWTVDDGANPDVVRAYAEFARRTGTRLTFFINGQYPSFEQHRELLLPLVKSGQLQIANHTYSHAALTKLSDEQIVRELTRNDEEIQRLFGVSSKPYFRPPYGYYDTRVLAAAASCGFTRPVLWYGSLADSSNIPSQEVLRFAKEYVDAQRIIIGHLNYPGVISVMDEIRGLMDRMGLTTVTIRDYYG